MSQRRAGIPQFFLDNLKQARERWRGLEPLLTPIARNEPYRIWLRILQWRIEQTQSAKPFEPLPDGAYGICHELLDDLLLIRKSLHAHPGGKAVGSMLEEWICQVKVFGFHMMRLDIRQESSVYHTVMDEILRAIGAGSDYAAMNESQRQDILTRTLGHAEKIDETNLSEDARDTLALYRLLAETARLNGSDALGAHVISMTHEPSDFLAVLWLSTWASRVSTAPQSHDAERSAVGDAHPTMPIVPLFETIDDLRRAPKTLDAILTHPTYRKHVQSHQNSQIIMIGYSDSTKDGGYLTAQWQLHEAQIELQRVTRKHDVRAVFFHGRGGSLGRGGGPAARSILSLPPDTVDGAVRMTEQGEVLVERYDDPQVAQRHLEQVTWATMLVSAQRPVDLPTKWREIMAALSADALRAYRELIEQPGFLTYFDLATPISEIERLPIGSRPARRHGERTLNDLRAIPWVFSWTQNRHFIPAWYGLGSAVVSLAASDSAVNDTLREMYEHWPFFKATIDNAALALAKADIGIAHHYAELVPDEAQREAIWGRIRAEFERSRHAILDMSGGEDLLDSIAWLKRSIEVRNPHVDPINFIQIELFRRLRESGHELDDTAAHAMQWLIRMSIQGIAAGLRTTG